MGMSDIKIGSTYKARGIEGTLQGSKTRNGATQLAIDCLLPGIDADKGGMRVHTVLTAQNKDGSLNEYTRDRLLTMGWDGKAKRFGGYWTRDFEMVAIEETYTDTNGVEKKSVKFEVRTENMQFKFKDQMAEGELDALSEMMGLGGQAEERGGYPGNWDDDAGSQPKTKKVDI